MKNLNGFEAPLCLIATIDANMSSGQLSGNVDDAWKDDYVGEDD